MGSAQYTYNEFVEYIRTYPSIISDLMDLIVAYDLVKVIEYFEELDLTIPYIGPPNNEGYLKNKSDIDEIITSPDAYIIKPDILNQDYMEDKHTIEIYSRTVDIFDEVVTNYLPPVPRSEAISLLGIMPKDKVLEICIGPGSSFKYYPEYGNIEGIDISPESIIYANNKIDKLGANNINAVLMDIHKTVYDDNTFDKVISICGLCVVRNPYEAMEEIKRISKPGAIIVLYEPCVSNIGEIAMILYLLQPIGRIMGGVWYKDFPPYVIPYNCYYDLFGILRELGYHIESDKIYDEPYNALYMVKAVNIK